jgi:FHS family L-fucose permease-like MFS transporter
MKNQSTNWTQFIPLITVFFFWGFVAASNDILIPVFQEKFELSSFESQFVSLAFYIAYAVGSLIYFLISQAMGKDILNTIGYKNGISLGLVISAVGSTLFYFAAIDSSLYLMLSGLFVVALGFSLQQIAANPLAVVMGDPKTGSQRLTLAGGVNNFGTTIGPLLVSFAIFGSVGSGEKHLEIEAVKMPYLILTLAFLAVAAFIKFSSVPNFIDLEEVAHEEAQDDKLLIQKSSAFHYPQLIFGMLAIFMYVGVEVSTASHLPLYLKEKLNIPTSEIAPYISLYWASMMIGRWTGAVGAFDFSGDVKKILKFVAPYLAFGVFLLVNSIANHDVSQFYIYAFVIAYLLIMDILSKGNPAKMLLYFALSGAVALTVGIFTTGMISVYAFVSGGLFCSTLWPCIFTLAVTGLGKNTNQGSSFLIMMIMGGGIISALQGKVTDLIGVQQAYIVGVVCFIYLASYAIIATRTLKSQGIDLDKLTAEGGH